MSYDFTEIQLSQLQHSLADGLKRRLSQNPEV
jgi:hypothetical protein